MEDKYQTPKFIMLGMNNSSYIRSYLDSASAVQGLFSKKVKSFLD